MRYKFNSNGLAQGCAIPLKCEPITLGTAAVLGGASLLGSVFSGLFGSSERNTSYKQQRELMKYNQELGFENMRYQQRLGLDTFDKTFSREASLNSQLMRTSPAIQKEAAISAGINPASQFGAFSGNLAQSSVPTYTPQSGAPSAPAMPNTDMYGLGSLITKLADLAVQTPLVEANVRKTNAEARNLEDQHDDLLNKLRAETDYLRESARGRAIENDYTPEKFELEFNKIRADIDNTIQDTSNKKGEANLMQRQAEHIIHLIDLVDAQKSLTEIEKQKYSAEIKETYAKIRKLNKEIDNYDRYIDSVINNNNSLSSYTEDQRVELKARILSMAYELNIKAFVKVVSPYLDRTTAIELWNDIHGLRVRRKTKYFNDLESKHVNR